MQAEIFIASQEFFELCFRFGIELEEDVNTADFCIFQIFCSLNLLSIVF